MNTGCARRTRIPVSASVDSSTRVFAAFFSRRTTLFSRRRATTSGLWTSAAAVRRRVRSSSVSARRRLRSRTTSSSASVTAFRRSAVASRSSSLDRIRRGYREAGATPSRRVARQVVARQPRPGVPRCGARPSPVRPGARARSWREPRPRRPPSRDEQRPESRNRLRGVDVVVVRPAAGTVVLPVPAQRGGHRRADRGGVGSGLQPQLCFLDVGHTLACHGGRP